MFAGSLFRPVYMHCIYAALATIATATNALIFLLMIILNFGFIYRHAHFYILLYPA